MLNAYAHQCYIHLFIGKSFHLYLLLFLLAKFQSSSFTLAPPLTIDKLRHIQTRQYNVKCQNLHWNKNRAKFNLSLNRILNKSTLYCHPSISGARVGPPMGEEVSQAECIILYRMHSGIIHVCIIAGIMQSALIQDYNAFTLHFMLKK